MTAKLHFGANDSSPNRIASPTSFFDQAEPRHFCYSRSSPALAFQAINEASRYLGLGIMNSIRSSAIGRSQSLLSVVLVIHFPCSVRSLVLRLGSLLRRELSPMPDMGNPRVIQLVINPPMDPMMNRTMDRVVGPSLISNPSLISSRPRLCRILGKHLVDRAPWHLTPKVYVDANGTLLDCKPIEGRWQIDPQLQRMPVPGDHSERGEHAHDAPPWRQQVR